MDPDDWCNNGIAVISYYGISASNADSDKRRINERYPTTLWRYLAHHRKKPIFICLDANVHIDKSEVLQAMKVAGWKDVSNGLGDTFRSGSEETRKDLFFLCFSATDRTDLKNIENHNREDRYTWRCSRGN